MPSPTPFLYYVSSLFYYRHFFLDLLFLFIYLFYLFLAALGVSFRMWDLSLWRVGFSLVVAHGLQGAWAL